MKPAPSKPKRPEQGRIRPSTSRPRKSVPPERVGDRDRKPLAEGARELRKSAPATPASAAVGRHRSGGRDRADESEAEKVDIGFKKPPKGHCWKKGQSGNPKGRKKGSRNKKTVIISLMEGRLGRKIPDPRKLTAQEAMLWKAIQKGLAGDAKAMAFAFKRYDDATANAWVGPVITTEEDQQVYDALRAKIRREIEDEQ